MNGQEDIYTNPDYAKYYLDREPGRYTLFRKLSKELQLYALEIKDSYNDYYEHVAEQVTLLDEWDNLALRQLNHQENFCEDAVLLKTILADILSTLTYREHKVIEMRYGLRDGRERNLEEIAMSFGVTRERIKQIEKKALHKLQHPSRMKLMKPFISFAGFNFSWIFSS